MVKQLSSRGFTPLMLTCQVPQHGPDGANAAAVARYLLQKDIDPRPLADKPRKGSALHVAAKNGNLQSGSCHCCLTMLLFASMVGCYEIVQALLDARIDPTVWSGDEMEVTPLHLAAGAGHTAIVRM